MPPIGLAVIGAGYWGPNLVRSALVTPELELKWLCDLELERARRVLGSNSAVGGSPSS
jgi:predicted dehydrogenase